MILVRNLSHETILVRHSANIVFREYLKPGDERRFAGFGAGHFTLTHSIHRTRDPRFDPRGGDPYNRVGTKVHA